MKVRFEKDPGGIWWGFLTQSRHALVWIEDRDGAVYYVIDARRNARYGKKNNFVRVTNPDYTQAETLEEFQDLASRFWDMSKAGGLL